MTECSLDFAGWWMTVVPPYHLEPLGAISRPQLSSRPLGVAEACGYRGGRQSCFWAAASSPCSNIPKVPNSQPDSMHCLSQHTAALKMHAHLASLWPPTLLLSRRKVVIFMTGRIAAYYAEAFRKSGTSRCMQSWCKMGTNGQSECMCQ